MALRQVQGLGPPARFQVKGRVRAHQGSHIRDVHPHALALQADRVVRGLVALVVDGKGRQVGQISARFIRQRGHGQVGRKQRHAQAARVRIDRLVPVARLQQERVRVFGVSARPNSRSARERAAFAPGQLLDLFQVALVFRDAFPAAGARQESLPGAFLGGLPGAGGLALLPARPGWRPAAVRRTAEIQPVQHELPGRPRRGGGGSPKGQLGQLRQRGARLPRGSPRRRASLPARGTSSRQAVQRPWMQQLDVLGAHALRLPAQVDFQALARMRHARRLAVVEHERAGWDGLFGGRHGGVLGEMCLNYIPVGAGFIPAFFSS